MPDATWYVYLLRCADDSLYCGVTVDLERRIGEHNAGTGARYTRSRRPVALAASARVAGRSEALRLEAAVKRLPRGRKLARLAAAAAEAPREAKRDDSGPGGTDAPDDREPAPG